MESELFMELFNIFGDRETRPPTNNVSRQHSFNIENMGKSVSTGPIKPNEPLKKGAEPKKSFLCNKGQALQSTPTRQVFTPRAVDIGALIFQDDNDDGDVEFDNAVNEELELTKSVSKCDDYTKDCLDYFIPEPELNRLSLSPCTLAPHTRRMTMELDCSRQDEFFTDFSNESIPVPNGSDLGLPDIY